MLDILLGLLIALLPVIIAIIFTKRYNMVHGLVCFITSAAAVLLFFYKFDEHLPAEKRIRPQGVQHREAHSHRGRRHQQGPVHGQDVLSARAVGHHHQRPER